MKFDKMYLLIICCWHYELLFYCWLMIVYFHFFLYVYKWMQNQVLNFTSLWREKVFGIIFKKYIYRQISNKKKHVLRIPRYISLTLFVRLIITPDRSYRNYLPIMKRIKVPRDLHLKIEFHNIYNCKWKNRKIIFRSYGHI